MHKHLFLVMFGIALFTSAYAQEVFVKGGEAIRGYDPVAYFVESKAVKGLEKFSHEWREAKWLFSSEENLTAFRNDPEKYAPQFGGYCAYGVADGHKSSTSPDAWTIADGKLYLNYNLDVRKLWKENQKQFIEKALVNWPEVKLQKD